MTSVTENALNKPRSTNHTECKLPRSEICPSICCVLHYGKCIIKAWSRTKHSFNTCKLYINSDISLDSSYKAQILIHNRTSILHSWILHFWQIYALFEGSWPNAHNKNVSQIYTILGSPHRNIKLAYYRINNCGSLSPNTSYCLHHYL
jgi:hypothetical protein